MSLSDLVRDALTKHPDGLTSSELRRGLGCPPRKLKHAIYWLVNSGQVYHRKGRWTTERVYFIRKSPHVKAYISADAAPVWKFDTDYDDAVKALDADDKWAALMGERRFEDFIPARLRVAA